MTIRMDIRFVNAGTPRSYPDFVAAYKHTVTSTQTDLAQLLVTLSHYSRTIGLHETINADGVTFQGFGTAFYTLLTEFQPFPPLDGEAGKVYLDQKALSVIREAEGVQEDWVAIPDPTTRKEEAKLSLLRIVAEMSLFQQEPIFKVANALVIAGLKPYRRLGCAPKAIDRLFRKHIGISAYEYYLILFGVWVSCARSPVFNIETILSKAKRKKDVLRCGITLCEELSKTPGEYCSSGLDSEIEGLSAKFRGSAYFSVRPLISMGKNFFACVAHPFLRTYVTSKFIQKALALSRIEEPDAGGRTTLSAFMGQTRLEAFFRELCEEWGPPGGHHDEFVYSNKMKSPDRIIFENVGSAPFVTLVQLKLKTLPTKVHFAQSFEKITEDYAKSFADCIFKSIKFIYNAQKANSAGDIDPQYKTLCARILSSENFCFVGIVPDLPTIFSISYARQALESEINTRIAEDKKLAAWVKEKFKNGLLWHIMDLTEFQFILSVPTTISLAEELSSYVTSTGINSDPLQGKTLPPSFKNFLIGKYGTDKDGRGKRLSELNPRLRKLFFEASKDVRYFIFKPFFLRWGRVAYFGLRESCRYVGARLIPRYIW